MSGHPSGPGKTAPKLYRDFLLFDPLKVSNGRNVLVDHPPPVGEGPQFGYQPGACVHEYTTKHAQSILPPLDLRSDGTTQYRLAVVCRKCRLHADIYINCSHSTKACPNEQNPLHHLQFLSNTTESGRIKYTWQCSSQACVAHLQITFRQPRLTGQDHDLLCSTDKLRQRFETIKLREPEREGMRQATPIDALMRLRRYIRDSLDANLPRRSIPANNKRFQEAFGYLGEDCTELLTRLGFKYADVGEWGLPDPAPIEHRLQANGNSLSELLEDVEMELAALIFRTAAETSAINPIAGEGWPSANRDVERILAAQGYQRYVPPRRSPTANEDNAYFASLGALPDFADTLIEFAYERQTVCDPERQRYYFECLQVIAENRGSEQLQIKAVQLSSAGLFSRRDISQAYRAIGLSAANSDSMTDDYILSAFEARQGSVSPSIQQEHRDALYKIGVSRNSQPLMKAAQQSVETYEDALAWLGPDVNKDSPDDHLIAMAAARGETPADAEITKKAIAAINRERKSNMLNDWLLTGSGEGLDMSVEEALRLMGVSESLSSLDPETLDLMLQQAESDNPSEQIRKAIKTIRDAMAGGITAPQPQSSADWPVGLISHGNTCYLNSILQYYFSIEPFRNIVLHYDEYKRDLEEAIDSSIRVNGTVLTKEEVTGGQRFAKELRLMFDRMIKAPTGTVKPSTELVCLGFLPAAEYKLAGDMEEPEIVKNGTQHTEPASMTTADGSHKVNGERKGSDASSATLAGSVNGDEHAKMVNGGELPPSPPASPKQASGTTEAQAEKRPPLPPRHRRFSTNEEHAALQRRAWDKAQENAKAQQDVNDVHNNLINRLRQGMRGTGGVDSDGDQYDALQVVYTISTTDTPLDENGVPGKPSQLNVAAVQLQFPKPIQATDIYAALDQVFDLTSGPRPSYKSIISLPAVVQITIPRVAFLQGAAQKLDYPIKLEDVLYLDRYVDSSDPSVLEARQKCWAWRSRLRELKAEKAKLEGDATADNKIDGPTAVGESAKYFASLHTLDAELQDIGMDGLEVDPNLTTSLSHIAESASQRVAIISAQISSLTNQIDTAFQSLTEHKYRLAAVFFHRGNTGGGHYWVCIRDFGKDLWRRYNDERVEEVPKNKINEIYEASTWEHGTPTFVVYVRDEKKEELVQPVCRDPEPVPEVVKSQLENNEGAWPPSDDVAMGGTGESQQQVWQQVPPPSGTVDPKMISEGGEVGWDQKREVAGANW